MNLPLGAQTAAAEAATPAANAARDRLLTLRWAAFAALLAPAGLLLWSAHAMWVTYSPTPFSDQWSELYWWRNAPHDGWLNYLVSQHNEHRILFPRLFFLADWNWFQGRDVVNLVAIGLTQLVGAAFFLHLADLRRAGAIGLMGAAVALSLVFSLMQWENLVWGFQVQFVGVYALGAWALYAFCAGSQDPKALRWGLLATSVLLLALATFNMANGVLAGAAMAGVAVVTRRGLIAPAVVVVATGVLLALYLHGYHAPGYHAPPSLALHHPGRYVTYVAIYLGNIWCPGKGPQAALVGLVGIAATAGMLVVVVRDRTRDPARAALLGLAVFVGLSAAMTALGRLHLGVGQALSSRYMTPTAYFWGAQAVFWALTARRSFARPLVAALAGGLALALLVLVQLQSVGYGEVLERHNGIVTATSALLGDVEDRDALLDVYQNTEMLHDLAPFLRKERLGLYADAPAAVVGARFTRPMAPAGACRGVFDALALAPEPAVEDEATAVAGVSHRPPPPGGVWRALGWGWDLKARRSLPQVVMVDSAGVVVGIGVSGIARADVKHAVREVSSLTSGWVVSMNHGANGAVVAYGITAAGDACELGRKVWPR